MAIIRALAPGTGRSNLCDSEDELIERLDQAVVIYDPADLPAALSLLEAGELWGQFYRLRRPQPLRQPSAFGTAERGPGLSRIDRQVIGAAGHDRHAAECRANNPRASRHRRDTESDRDRRVPL